MLPAVKIGNLITSGLEKVTGKKFGRQTTKELASTKAGKILGIATVGTAAITAVAINPSLAARAVTGLLPKSAVGRAATTLAGGAVVTSPTVRKAVFETPSVIFETGEAIGAEVEKEKKAGGATSKTTQGLIIGAAAGLLIPKIIDKGKKSLDKIPSPAEAEAAFGQIPSSKGTQGLPALEDFPGSPALTPETPATQELNPKKKRKASKKRLEAPRQTITQRVDVRVNAGNKRYINMTRFSR